MESGRRKPSPTSVMPAKFRCRSIFRSQLMMTTCGSTRGTTGKVRLYDISDPHAPSSGHGASRLANRSTWCRRAGTVSASTSRHLCWPAGTRPLLQRRAMTCSTSSCTTWDGKTLTPEFSLDFVELGLGAHPPDAIRRARPLRQSASAEQDYRPNRALKVEIGIPPASSCPDCRPSPVVSPHHFDSI